MLVERKITFRGSPSQRLRTGWVGRTCGTSRASLTLVLPPQIDYTMFHQCQVSWKPSVIVTTPLEPSSSVLLTIVIVLHS